MLNEKRSFHHIGISTEQLKTKPNQIEFKKTIMKHKSQFAASLLVVFAILTFSCNQQEVAGKEDSMFHNVKILKHTR